MRHTHYHLPLLLLFLSLTVPTTTTSFTLLPSTTTKTTTPPQQQTHHKTTFLTSKRPKKKPSSGGGFGSSSSSKKPSKTRSVSGYTGSGTKPLRVAANTYDALHKSYGKECVADVYVRSPLQDPLLFWFVGKVGRCTSLEKCDGNKVPTEVEAALAQKRLILEYAKSLRPQNLGGGYGKGLELWLAPGDSEMDVVQNKVTLLKVEGTTAGISDDFSVADVGYDPEIYVGDEIDKGGLRVERDEHGQPLKPVFEIGA